MGSARATRDDAITAAFAGAPRAAMGEAAFATAFAQGQRLRLADALAEARHWLGTDAAGAKSAAHATGETTR